MSVVTSPACPRIGGSVAKRATAITVAARETVPYAQTATPIIAIARKGSVPRRARARFVS
jgi:hypothetical protein